MRILLWGAMCIATLFAVFFVASSPFSAHAVTSVPTKMNFQGRITDASGNILPNGTYNMKFRIYNALTAGALQWNEDRLVSATQGVTVTNGQFSVQLGSISSLPASIFTSNSLYFEIELPTPATATSSTPSWTEGAMGPRNQLATSAYAFNADAIDGIDGSNLFTLDATQTVTGTKTFTNLLGLQGGVNINGGITSDGEILFNGADTQLKFRVNDNAGQNLFRVETLAVSGTQKVIIGTADANAVLLVLDTKNTAGDPTGTNGAMYYNSNLNTFRCYENGAWSDCDVDYQAANNIFSGTNAFNGTTVSVGGAASAAKFNVASLFNVDSTNSIISIGAANTTGTVLVLDTKNTTGDPTGSSATNGAMYYNSFLQKFRCYEGGGWQNCGAAPQTSASTATQALTAGTDTYLTGSTLNLPAGGMQGPTGTNQDGSLLTWKVYLYKTSAAGTAASTFTLRFGTAGTTADTSRCTFSTGTATGAVDGGTATITAYATAGGATTTLNCAMTMTHNQVNSGLSSAPIVQTYSTATSFTTQTAGTKAGLSFNAGTTSTITVQKVEANAVNL
jgi:hypothetical protein